MAVSRLIYATALALCALFYLAWGAWLYWVVLVALLIFPWVSLVLSLPAILRFRTAPSGTDALLRGTPGEIFLLGSCPFPAPPFRGRLRLKNLLTGQQRLYKPEKGLPTEHCGGFRVTVERAWVCDYLGLFSFPVRKRETKNLVIRPVPLPLSPPPEPERAISRTWQPKPGGGFSEQQELRPYRPGDSLKQLHWKLSAKTGTLTLREPMEPVQGLVLLTMNLMGTPAALDRMFGRLSWLGARLVQSGIPFELRALTGEGLAALPVTSEKELQAAIDRLLCTPAAREGDLRQQCFDAVWQYHIGGDPDG